MREGFFIWEKCRNLNNKNRLRRLCINLPHTSGSPRIICWDFKNTNKETQKKASGQSSRRFCYTSVYSSVISADSSVCAVFAAAFSRFSESVRRSLSLSFLTKYKGRNASTATIDAARKILNGGVKPAADVSTSESPIISVINGPIIIGRSTLKHILTPWNLPSVPVGI